MGFDIECIQNIQSLAGEYFCPVCRLLVYPDEALQTQCTHLYCKTCLTYVVSTTHACPYDGYPVAEADTKPLKEANQALAETIGRIAVTCLYHRSGCTWQGTLSESTAHCAGCSFGNSPVMCNRCGAQIVHRQVLEHSQICLGEQPLTQQVENAPAGSEQNQAATQAGTPASQPSQNVAAPVAGQAQSQGASNSQAQAMAQTPTPEQWYQQQQQYYQQYYQQYPGYDPYQQQYQQYAQYQQQQFQQQQLEVPPQQLIQGQPQPQPYVYPHPQPQTLPLPQTQPQPQLQPQTVSQPQAQPQSQSQPQAQLQIQPQPQPHSQPQLVVQPQMQAQVNPPQQLHSQTQPHPPMQPQTHPTPHAQMQVPQLGHPHPQPQPQPQPHQQPHPQQHPQMMPQHPQLNVQQPPHSQQQSQLQPYPHAQPHLPHHPNMHLQQPQPHPTPHAQPQALPQPHTNPHHPQLQQSVTGYQSYPQSQPHQQMQPVHSQPQGAPHQLPQHPGQFPPQQVPQMRPPNAPPQSHVPVQYAQQPNMLPPHGQHPNIPPMQQQSGYHQAHHPGQPIHHQPVPQQQAHMFVHQPQLLPRQGTAPIHGQPYQQGPFASQQTMQQPHQSLCPQVPPTSLPQHAHAHPQWLQSIPSAQGALSQQSQNPAVRPLMPDHAAMQQPFAHSPGGLAGPTHGPDARAVAKPTQPLMSRSSSQTASLASQSGMNASHVSAADAYVKPIHEDSVTEKATKEGHAVSHDTEGADMNDSVTAHGVRADSVDLKIPKSEGDLKSVDAEEKPIIESEIGGALADHGKDPQSAEHNDDIEEPVTKQIVKEDVSTEPLQPSAGGSLADSVKKDPEDEIKQDSLYVIKEGSDGSLSENLSLQLAENFKGRNGKLQKDTTDSRMCLPWLDARSAISQGSTLGSERSNMHAPSAGFVPNPLQHEKPLPRPGFHDGNVSQFSHHVSDSDEYRGLPPPSQMPSRNFGQPSQPVPFPDQERYRRLPSPYGPPPNMQDCGQQQPHAPDGMLPALLPLPGPIQERRLWEPLPHQLQVPGQPLLPMRPQDPQQRQPSIVHNHFQRPLAKHHSGSLHQEVPPGSVPGPGIAASVGRETSHFDPPHRGFEPHSMPPLGHNPGHMPLLHSSGPIFSHGEPSFGPRFGAPHPGAFDTPGGMVVRGHLHGPEGQIGRPHPTNPIEAEFFVNQRPSFFDGRRSDPHMPLSVERFSLHSGAEMMKLNGVLAKGLAEETAIRHGAQEDRFKSTIPEDRHRPILEEGSRPPLEEVPKPFSLEHGHHIIDRREFQEDLKQFPRPAHLDGECASKFEDHFSSSRHFDRMRGFGRDAGPDGSGSFPVGSGGPAHPVDVGERLRPIIHDHMGRKLDPSVSHPDSLGPVSEFGHHHINNLPPRSPGRDYPRLHSRRFGSNPDGIGLGSGTLPLPVCRSEPDGLRNLRIGEQLGPGNLPVHLRSGNLAGPDSVRGHLWTGELLGPGGHLHGGEPLGPRNLPGHLRIGEPRFGGFPSHLQMNELAGPGNSPSHLQIGEPGFGSRRPLFGIQKEGGYFKQDSIPSDAVPLDSRKRKPGSMGWCRICKIDCETVEGLDLHSQTKEHQKMAMDMVLSIKQGNAKKQKLSSEEQGSLGETNKSRKAGLDSRGNRH